MFLISTFLLIVWPAADDFSSRAIVERRAIFPVSEAGRVVNPQGLREKQGEARDYIRHAWVWCRHIRMNRSTVYTRSEFQRLIDGKAEVEIVNLLGVPDEVLRLGGLCIGICYGEDVLIYRNCVGDGKVADTSACIFINVWARDPVNRVTFFCEE